jgi:hypothetical protein
MSKELRRKLQLLQDDYAGQPLVVQQPDLREINQLRAQLGMPQVDAHLKEIGTATVAEKVLPKAEVKPDHREAREIYQAYLKKAEELQRHRDYADEVAHATSGSGMTPVRPLATMGTNGGPLLCDHCKKPILLESGPYHGMTADAAWKKNPNPDANWRSYILGGMVVEIQTNGTLRIYHGYPGRHNNHCCNIASREDHEAREVFVTRERSQKRPLLIAFLEHEFPDLEKAARTELLNDILDVMYSYDPGYGVNRPGKKS